MVTVNCSQYGKSKTKTRSTGSSTKTYVQWVSMIKSANTLYAYQRNRMENNNNNITKLLHKSAVLLKLDRFYFLAQFQHKVLSEKNMTLIEAIRDMPKRYVLLD